MSLENVIRTAKERLAPISVLFSLSVLMVVVSTAQARDLRTAVPREQGLSPQRLERITAHMNKAVEDGIMVGGLGMIARNGKIVYQQTYGLSDREAGTAMMEDSLFRIYSMTKPITAVALMMLYEEGRFFLNDPVAKYLPELASLQVVESGDDDDDDDAEDKDQVGATRAPQRQPTIRDLLRHTAGFSYGVFGDSEVDRLYRNSALLEQDTVADFVTELGKIPLLYEPGSKWHYSIAVDVQGRLVEVLSGMRFGAFLKQRIFEPLEMSDTFFVVPEEKRQRLAKLYSPEGASVSWGKVWERNQSTTLVPAKKELDRSYEVGATMESGGAGLVSSAEDYMRFCLMMLNGGELDGVRILSPKTVELMTRNHLGSITMGGDGSGRGFGLGFAIALDPGQIGEIGSVGEYSWGGAAGTSFWIDPQEQFIGVFMVQSIPHQTRLGREFKILSYQAVIN